MRIKFCEVGKDCIVVQYDMPSVPTKDTFITHRGIEYTVVYVEYALGEYDGAEIIIHLKRI